MSQLVEFKADELLMVINRLNQIIAEGNQEQQDDEEADQQGQEDQDSQAMGDSG